MLKGPKSMFVVWQLHRPRTRRWQSGDLYIMHDAVAVLWTRTFEVTPYIQKSVAVLKFCHPRLIRLGPLLAFRIVWF